MGVLHLLIKLVHIPLQRSNCFVTDTLSFFTELHHNGERGGKGTGKEKNAQLITDNHVPATMGNMKV